MSAAPCKRCGQRPKRLPQHFCDICLEVKLPPAEQAALALARAEAQSEGIATGVVIQPTAFEISTRKKADGMQWCRGCLSYRVIDIPALSVLMNTPTHIKMHVAPGASRCRACIAVQRRQATYGLTPENQAALLTLQNNRCAICGKHGRDRALAVDHDHKTGVVRGFVCKQCNHDLLGGLHDSPELAAKALVYLLNPPAAYVDGLEPTAPLDWETLVEKVKALIYDASWVG